jgi:hypothetical protein
MSHDVLVGPRRDHVRPRANHDMEVITHFGVKSDLDAKQLGQLLFELV